MLSHNFLTLAVDGLHLIDLARSSMLSSFHRESEACLAFLWLTDIILHAECRTLALGRRFILFPFLLIPFPLLYLLQFAILQLLFELFFFFYPLFRETFITHSGIFFFIHVRYERLLYRLVWRPVRRWITRVLLTLLLRVYGRTELRELICNSLHLTN